MFGPCDHFILHILGKPDKIITASADTYNKIPIFFRLCPCRFKCVCVNRIDLHLKSAAPGIGLNNTFKSIHSHYEEKITIDSLCKLTYMSRSTLLRHFQKMCRQSPIDYLNNYRCKIALELSLQKKLSGEELALKCRFYDAAHMKRVLKRYKSKLKK